MPISIPVPRPLDVVHIEANSFKILGFEVHTETEVANEDRVFVRKEARIILNGTMVSSTPLRGTEYTATTMLPILADIGKRFAAALGLQLPQAPDDQLGFALYLAFRDGLYDAERKSGEFPADAT